uniref:Uncharacterized protein n=1 Tax=Myripristis murdjan TaxID=586833 RepID=A0A667ZSS0_9TELE
RKINILVIFVLAVQEDAEERDEVDVRKSDSQSPCEIEKYQQSPRQAFGKHSVGPTGGPREPEH